jgi:hypothetical protein
MIENKYCDYCGARMKMYWHSLTPGLVKTLVKIYKAVAQKGENKIHPHNEMNLTTTEHMNMTKLRFHAMIAKYKENGEIERGYWLITKRGSDFLKGKINVPHRVQTYRNRVKAHDENYVYVKDVIGTEPFWEKEFEYDIFEPHQSNLI